MNNFKKIVPLIIVLLISMLLSCGSSGTNPAGTNGQQTNNPLTGSVAIMMTDGYTDDFSKVDITISSIELLSDGGNVTVFSGEKQFNLLDLKNETILFSMQDNIPAEQYEKIRLTVTDVMLYDLTGEHIDKPVKLPGNNKIDLKPAQPFQVVSGEMLTLQLDIDAEKSIKLHENKLKYMFRPVVFIDIVGLAPLEKMTRISGKVQRIDIDGREITVCPDYINDENRPLCCITVSVPEGASIFNAQTDGEPAEIGDIMQGDTITVIGFLTVMPPSMDPGDGTDIDSDSDSEDIDESDDSNDDNEAVNTVSHNIRTCNMNMEAVVVQIGAFEKLQGTVLSPVDEDSGRFNFMVASVQGYGMSTEIEVLIGDATKIYSSSGEELDKSAIEVDSIAEIDGIMLLSDSEPDTLVASFISIDDGVIRVPLSGMIDNIDHDAGTFDLIMDTDTVCVEIPDDVKIFMIMDNSSEIIGFADLENGLNADLYEDPDAELSTCIVPEIILAFDVQA